MRWWGVKGWVHGTQGMEWWGSRGGGFKGWGGQGVVGSRGEVVGVNG